MNYNRANDGKCTRYETQEANRETHRAGEAYREFRAAVAAEGLLNGYPDMRFWCATGMGFLTRAPINMMVDREATKNQYIVVQDLSPKQGAKSKVLDTLGSVVNSVESVSSVGSFWVLERENKEDGDDVIVFARFDYKNSYEAFMATDAGQTWKTVGDLCQAALTTTWTEAGIGFLGR